VSKRGASSRVFVPKGFLFGPHLVNEADEGVSKAFEMPFGTGKLPLWPIKRTFHE
jgi:hypothetical protein